MTSPQAANISRWSALSDVSAKKSKGVSQKEIVFFSVYPILVPKLYLVSYSEVEFLSNAYF